MTKKPNFDRFHEAVLAAMDWVEGLGVRVGRGRFGEYRRVAEAIRNSIAADDDAHDTQVGTEYLEAGSELILIHKHLSHETSDEFVRRMEKYVAGSVLQSEESPKTGSSEARNFGYELVLAAHFAAAGFPPEFPVDGDLTLPSPIAHIECKRPQAEKRVADAVRTARKQLETRAEDIDPRPIGILCLSIGKIVHSGNKILVANDEQHADTMVGDRVEQFITTHSRHWLGRESDAVLAALVYYSGPVKIPSSEFFGWMHYVGFQSFRERCDETEFAYLEILGEQLSRSIPRRSHY